jgi:hypothetical protein
MEIVLTKAAVVFAYKLFWFPQSMTENKVHYGAKDTLGAADIISIQRWLATKVFKTINDNGAEQFHFVPYKGKIKESYLKRLKDIVAFYEPSGYLLGNIEGYLDLRNGLEGKITQTDEVEEV